MTERIKAGDTVKVVSLWGTDEEIGIKLGNVYIVKSVDSDGDVYIKVADDYTRIMFKHQVEKVEETVEVTKEYYQVGDKVEVTELQGCDRDNGIKVGDRFTIHSIDWDGDVRIVVGAKTNYLLTTDQIKKVNSMTFAEMAAKLISGEFERGTELIAGGKSYFVRKPGAGYALSKNMEDVYVSAELNSVDFNSKWTVKKEEPVKEMSIEELQKELGYKVKIVE